MKFSFVVLLYLCLASTCIPNELTAQSASKDYVDFTLQNTTAFSIPLIIPSVMNPNLSPFSKSSVGLKIGQEVFFKNKKKKYLLLKVDETIKDGAVLDVATLIKERKKELGL
jgi:hypothetical protein